MQKINTSTLYTKRAIDILLSLLLLIFFSPLFLIVSIVIRLTSPGPIFFKQTRVGLGGNLFTIFKFRSMYIERCQNAGEKKAINTQRKCEIVKMKHDMRVTRIGRYIRRTSIDELPQLYNILKGDMSLVGPRPLIPFMLNPFPEFCRIRNKVRPGITGLWQIRDREHNTNAKYMVAHDVEYVENLGIIMDLKILLATIKIVISGKGAY